MAPTGQAAEQDVGAGARGMAAHRFFGLVDGLLPVAEQVTRLREHEAAVLVVGRRAEHGLRDLGRIGPQDLGVRRAAIHLGLQQQRAGQHALHFDDAGEGLARAVEQVDGFLEAAAAAETSPRGDDPVGPLWLGLGQRQECIGRLAEAAAVLGAIRALAQRRFLGSSGGRRRSLAGQRRNEYEPEGAAGGPHVTCLATAVPLPAGDGAHHRVARRGSASGSAAPRPSQRLRPASA